MNPCWIQGDSLEATKQFPDESVDLILTSPPYLRKVAYLGPDHPDKELEIGTEESPHDFVETLLTHADEWHRILRPTGSIAIDLGDSRAGSGGAGGDYNPGGRRETQHKYEGTAAAARKRPYEWPANKSLCMIPEAFRLGLAYGHNPLDRVRGAGSIEHERWIVRNVVTLCKRSPNGGRQTDKFADATTDLVIACKSPDRYWNEDMPNPSVIEKDTYPKDYWVYRNTGRKGHPAGWPPSLLIPLIEAMTPAGAVVLDPFAGSGTTVTVAAGHGRAAIGIDLSPEYIPIAYEQVGMFLEVVDTPKVVEELQKIKDRLATSSTRP